MTAGTFHMQAGRALAILRAMGDEAVSVERSPGPTEDWQLEPAVVHSLISACGADVRSACRLWAAEIRPRVLALRRRKSRAVTRSDGPKGRGRGEDGGCAESAETRLTEPAGPELAAAHALLRVCGAAGRADEALGIVYALRRDGIECGDSCYACYESAARRRGRVRRGAPSLLQAGYERLLMMEISPERSDAPRLGKIERIRIQW